MVNLPLSTPCPPGFQRYQSPTLTTCLSLASEHSTWDNSNVPCQNLHEDARPAILTDLELNQWAKNNLSHGDNECVKQLFFSNYQISFTKITNKLTAK